MSWTHDSLMFDLAGYLDGPDKMVWTDMQLGPSGSPRPDVFTLNKSYSKPLPAAFECKVSRSDLRSDTTSGKWQSYLRFAASVTFAVPDGLCTVADIPDGCGLIVRKDAVWRYARRPTLQKVTPPFEACMKLLIDGVSRTFSQRQPVPRKIETWKVHEGLRHKFGEAVEQAARDLVAVQSRIDSLKSQEKCEYDAMKRRVEVERQMILDKARNEVSDLTRKRRELEELLGLQEGTSIFGIGRAIAELRAATDADTRVAVAEAKVESVRRTIEHALRGISGEKAWS